MAFTSHRPLNELLALFQKLPIPMEVKDKGLHGYAFCCSWPGMVNVLYSAGRPDIHVQITGRGCDNFSFVALLDLLVPGDSVTRCDIALDCMNAGFTCADIWGYLQRGDYISVSSSIRKFEWLVQGPERGYTIYIGSSSSERMVRIYDKGKESGTGTDWLRYEVQLKGRSANTFVLKVMKDGDFEKKAMGLLSKQIRLIQPMQHDLKENQHYSRIKNISYWDELTDCQRPFSLVLPKRTKTITTVMRHVKNTAASLKCLRGGMLDYDEWIHDLVDSVDLKAKHVQIQNEMLMPDQQAVDYMSVFPIIEADVHIPFC